LRTRMSAPKPERKQPDRSVQTTVYQSEKRGKPLARNRNRTQIKLKMLRHWRGAAKMLDRCSEWRHFFGKRPSTWGMSI
jgi:hypothetical protein